MLPFRDNNSRQTCLFALAVDTQAAETVKELMVSMICSDYSCVFDSLSYNILTNTLALDLPTGCRLLNILIRSGCPLELFLPDTDLGRDIDDSKDISRTFLGHLVIRTVRIQRGQFPGDGPFLKLPLGTPKRTCFNYSSTEITCHPT